MGPSATGETHAGDQPSAGSRPRAGFWYRLAILVIKPLLLAVTRRHWRGQENVPPTGGFIVAVNHVSHADPFTLAHYLYDGGRLPRFLAKSELWHVRFVGRVMRGAGQIPVHRKSADAADVLRDAVAAVKAGECVVVYPEGTTTKDPTYWPMVPKTGVARLALMTGAPVLPMAQWGVQQIFGQDRKLHLLPRHDVHVIAGPPVDLSAFAGQPLTAEVLRDATAAVMSDVRRLVGELRGEEPPAAVYDPRNQVAADEATTVDERRTA